MDSILKLVNLPSYVEYEGVEFELRLLINGTRDIRITYNIYSCNESSKHKKDIDKYGLWKNPFFDGRLKDFLFFYSGILDNLTFEETIEQCIDFLNKNKIIKEVVYE